MLIKGEKYACDACIRGHRVSTCQHHDRPLTHINKKGRPVSQCPHCRSLRKARSTHTQCDCGLKPHNKADCTHIDRADLKIWPHGDNNHDHEQGHHCCCTHGARCTCALKKEHLDTVPEVGLPDGCPTSNLETRRPARLTSTQSETTLTVFTNGHHKPVHKHNDMAHKCGAPYKIPRSHTIHGHSEIAQRSMDSLPLTKRALLGHEAALPQQDTITSAPHAPRLVKSEHGSPDLKPLTGLDPINTSISPLEASYSPYETGSPLGLPFGYECLHENYFAPHDVEAPLSSAGLSAPSVDWSTFGLPYDNPAFSAENSQPPSYASFDYNNLSHPGLTTSSSGDISEVEDYCPLPTAHQNGQDTAEISSVGDPAEADNHYRLSSASSYMGLPQASMLASNNLESLDIDDFLKNAEAQTTALEQITTTASLESAKTYSLVASDASENIPQSLSGLGNDDLSDSDAMGLAMNSAFNNSMWDAPYDSATSASRMNNGPVQENMAMWTS